MPARIVPLETMDEIISTLLYNPDATLKQVAKQYNIPSTTIYTELRSRGIYLKQDRLYEVCRNVDILYHAIEAVSSNREPFVCKTIDEIDEFYSLWTMKQNSEEEFDEPCADRYETLRVQLHISDIRDIWTEMCRLVAISISYNDIINGFDTALMFFNDNDVNAVKEIFFDYMTKKHKRWTAHTATPDEVNGGTELHKRIMNMWNETAERSDGRVIHLWKQNEIADECSVMPSTVNKVIERYGG